MAIKVLRPYPRTGPCWVDCRADGNQMSALIGPNVQEGVAGFGDDLPAALRALADELEREVGQEPLLGRLETKVLEIRDEGTFIAVLAIRMQGVNDAQRYYFRRCGYPEDGSSIMLMCLYDGKATNDPYEWGALKMGPRTLPAAHNWIIDHFAELRDGDVVDVQVLLGETRTPKTSERLQAVR